MKIGFIGAGKVGVAFGTYLQKNGFTVKGYYSRTRDSTLKAAVKTGSLLYEKSEELVEAVDFLLITTSDDEIEKVCDYLADKNAFREGQIVAHMSGALSSDVLYRARERGCYVYSIHPLQSFADTEKSVEDLKHTYFSVEGSQEKIEVIEMLFKRTGNRIFKISTEHKVIYHAAACIFSNYLAALINQGLEYFDKIGIAEKDGFEAILPLVLGTLRNIENLGTAQALTGPIARGDIETVLKHIKSIEKEIPKSLPFYKKMGQMTLKLASEYKLKNPEKIVELEKIFREV